MVDDVDAGGCTLTLEEWQEKRFECPNGSVFARSQSVFPSGPCGPDEPRPTWRGTRSTVRSTLGVLERRAPTEELD